MGTKPGYSCRPLIVLHFSATQHQCDKLGLQQLNYTLRGYRTIEECSHLSSTLCSAAPGNISVITCKDQDSYLQAL